MFIRRKNGKCCWCSKKVGKENTYACLRDEVCIDCYNWFHIN